jgi:hypothetical protein
VIGAIWFFSNQGSSGGNGGDGGGNNPVPTIALPKGT